MKLIAKKLLDMWPAIVFGLVTAIVIGLLLFWHIGSHPPGLSSDEVKTVQTSQSLHQIYSTPINSPLTFTEHFLLKINPHSITLARTTSTIYATLAIILFFFVLRFWQDTKTALLGTVLFGTSSWFLHVARLDTPDVLSLGVVLALALGLWFKHTLKRNFALIICSLAFGALLYVPGMIWFIIIGAIWINKDLLHELKHTNIAARIFGAVFFLASIVPLTLAIVKKPAKLFSVAGLPQHFSSITTIGHNLAHVPLWLLWRGPAADPTRWLGTTPVLNVFEIAMLVLGVYSFWKRRQMGRSKAVLGGILVSWILIALGGPISLTILLPFLYVAIAGGVLYMFENWFGVFPSNPLARATGIVVLVAACLLSCNYHLQNYFVAWQHSPATKNAFTHQLSKPD